MNQSEKVAARKGKGIAVLERADDDNYRIIAEIKAATKFDRTRADIVISRGGGSSDGGAELFERTIKHFDGILADPLQLNGETGRNIVEFETIYALTGNQILDEKMWLMRGNAAHYGRKGNRCKLTARHLLLAYLMFLKGGTSQLRLGSTFGVSQSSISRYVAKMSGIMLHRMPSAEWRLKALEGGYTEEAAPGGYLIFDCTIIPLVRPSDAKMRKLMYSGWKKMYCIKVFAITNINGEPVDSAFPVPGSVSDLEAARIYFEGRGKLLKKAMRRDRAGQRWQILADAGFVGLDKVLPDADVHLPHKKSKHHKLTRGEIRNNRRLARKRIRVEHYFGRMKNYAILRKPFKGSAEDLDQIFRAVTCLVDMRKARYRYG